MKDNCDVFIKGKKVHKIDWLIAVKIHDCLQVNKLVLLAVTHSVLWEQCISLGLSGIYKRNEHGDLGENELFPKTNNNLKLKDEKTYSVNKLQEQIYILGIKTLRFFGADKVGKR